jgi:hypothetical protein
MMMGAARCGCRCGGQNADNNTRFAGNWRIDMSTTLAEKFPTVVALLKSAMGVSDEQIDALPEEDLDLLQKSLPDGITPEEFGAAVEDDDVQDAIAAQDQDGLSSRLLELVTKGGKRKKDADDDEDEEDDDEDEGDGDDEDWADDVDSAAEELWGQDADDEEEEAPKKKRKSNKSLAGYMEDEGLDEFVDVEDVVEPVVKGLEAYLSARDVETDERLEAVQKSQRRMMRMLSDVQKGLESMGMRPAGRALPYNVGASPLDNKVGADVADVPPDVSTMVLKAQGAGAIDDRTAMRLIGAAQHGGEAWDALAGEFEKVKKAVNDGE